MPSRLSWGIGRAATLLKTLLRYFGKSLEALPGVAYPGFRDNRSTLNTKTGLKKKLASKICNFEIQWQEPKVKKFITKTNHVAINY